MAKKVEPLGPAAVEQLAPQMLLAGELVLRSALAQDMSKGLSNPQLVHQAFEALALVARVGAASEAVQRGLHERVVPLLARSVVAKATTDAVELLPYALQLLAVVVSFPPPGQPAPLQTIIDIAVSVATQSLAKQRAIAPALVRFLRATISACPQAVVGGGSGPLVPGITAVFNELLLSRTHAHDAFNLIFSTLPHLDSSIALESAVSITKNVFSALYLVNDEFARRPKNESSVRLARRFRRCVVLYVSIFVCFFGYQVLETVLPRVNPRRGAPLYDEVVTNVVARYAHLFTEPYETRIVALALSTLIANSEALSVNGRVHVTVALLCALGSKTARAERERNVEAADQRAQQNALTTKPQTVLRSCGGRITADRFVQLAAAVERPPVVMEGVDQRAMAASCIRQRLQTDVRPTCVRLFFPLICVAALPPLSLVHVRLPTLK